MRYFNIIIYLLLFTIAKSQNLVPNPSFETYTICPTNYFQINNASPWTYLSCAYSGDYYNICATSTNVSVPKNFFNTNYQQAKTGNAYAGIQTFHPSGYERSNISNQLTSTLLPNAYYLTKFYIVNVQSYDLANNNVALNFSNTLTYTVSSGSTVNLPMHIYKFGNPVIKDTLNWTEIMGIYKASGTEQYITIGNFKDNANTKTDTTNYGWIGYQAAYYMIDDISVEQICTPFWSYRDTTVTLGDSVLIGPAITGLNINWYDAAGTFIINAPGIYVKPNSPTFYTASEDFCNGITSHTINVMVTPTSVKNYNAFTNSISFFPNPTTNDFTISTGSSKLKVDITDTQGKLYSSELITITNNKATIKTNLTNGVYFVSITDTVSGLKAVKKLIVQK